MCAIAGITRDAQESMQESLKRMEYRGPDASAVYADGKVTLGHNRLSIIDLDPRSNQPFFDAFDEVGIVFNGEIYNFQILKRELEEEGCVFRTESDTEVIVYAYRQWGEQFAERLEGMFALALYDTRTGKLFLYGDHAAIKPLFYAQMQGSLLFASELKGIGALVRGLGEQLEVDEAALDTYYAFGQIPAPSTLYKKVRRLLPASYVVFDLGTHELTLKTYTPRSAAATGVEEAIRHAVRSHLIADVPVGLFFSGGVDSSLIASILREEGIALSAFCVDIADRPDDAAYAARVAELLDMSYERFPFGVEEFDAIYDEVVDRIDEPFADSSLFPTYYVAKKAREQVTVVLSGEGGDEYFLGYSRSRDLFSLRSARLDRTVGMTERLFFLLPAFSGKNRFFERLFVLLKKPIAFYLLTMSPSKSLMSPAQWSTAKRMLAASARRPAELDAEFYLPNILLRKADLATMYASIEARVPLLDAGVVAAAREAMKNLRSLPVLKPALKQMLAQYLPKDIVYRKKTGFGLRTRSYLTRSARLREDLAAAAAYLAEHSYLRIALPDEETLVSRYPNVCWQIIFLYHALKNAEV